MAPDPWGLVGALEAVAAVVLALILFVAGGRRPAPVALGAHFLFLGILILLLSLPSLTATPNTGWANLGVWIARLIVWTGLLVFAVVFPQWTLSRRKLWFVVWALIPAAFILLAFAVVPRLLVDGSGSPSLFFRNLVTALRDAGLLLGLAVFGRHWFRSQPGEFRHEFLYVLMAFQIFAINDGVGALAPIARGDVPTTLAGLLLAGLSAVGILASLGIALGSMVRARRAPGGSGRDDRLLAAWTLLIVPLSFLQFLGANPNHLLFIHFLVDGVAIFVLFYGVAKDHILDIRLKLRWTVSRGALAGIFLGAFFIATNVASNYLEQYGWAVGGIFAGILLFAVSPLQRFAERLSAAAVPGAVASPDYLAQRRIQIYKAAIEGALDDGEITSKERAMLDRLQRELEIAPSDAQSLERLVGQIRELQTGAGASPARAGF